VKDVNASQPASKYLSAEWTPLEGGKPFCTLAKGSDMRSCGSLEATPWGNQLIEELAERAIAGEQLGQHPGTDVLTVSFSSNDYVGHALGPDAPEVRDISIRTDRLLGKFLEYVDHQVGLANTVLVLTADHGVAPAPEVNAARKMPGGRLSQAPIFQLLSDALTAKYGEGKWLAGSLSAPYLNQELIRSKNLNPADVEDLAADLLRNVPHIFRVYTRHQLMNGQVPADAISQAAQNGFYPQRSGDLVVIPEAYYLFGGTSGTSHGLPFNYDTHVPVIFFGAGIKPGYYRMPAAANDIAPTVAELLGVEQPSGSVGRVLSEIIE
jgi:arylsulfatase A-like enzyme